MAFLETILDFMLDVLIPLCEIIGVCIVAVSVFSALYVYIKSLFMHVPSRVKFRLAFGLSLSLEFKMAAEILKTVKVQELSELAVLGIVIVLRALLSLLIHFEMKEDKPAKQENQE